LRYRDFSIAANNLKSRSKAMSWLLIGVAIVVVFMLFSSKR
jgi:hypothetical protein